MSETQILDRVVLDRLGDAMIAAGDPIVRRFEPGIPAEYLAQRVVNGKPLPIEVQQLWGWHDGATPKADRENTASFGGFASFCWLNSAVGHYEALSKHWGSERFPIAIKYASAILCDISGESTAPCPVSVFDLRNEYMFEPVTDAVLPSVRSLVELWIEALERGFWKYDRRGDPVPGEPWHDLPREFFPFVGAPERFFDR
jgi:hypothetical protein